MESSFQEGKGIGFWPPDTPCPLLDLPSKPRANPCREHSGTKPPWPPARGSLDLPERALGGDPPGQVLTKPNVRVQNCKSISQILTWRKSCRQFPVIWLKRIPLYKCFSLSLSLCVCVCVCVCIFLSPAYQKQAEQHETHASKTLRIPSRPGSAAQRICFPLLGCFIPIICDQPYCLLPRFFNF